MKESVVDYARHDDVYRELLARGATGWSTAEQYAVMVNLVRPSLPPATTGISPRILELGSGAGDFSMLLARLGYTVMGVDISPIAVNWANGRTRESGTSAVFRVDNVVELSSCDDAAFDVVVDGHCLHCIIGDDRAFCLAAVRRVLKPGGVFVVLSMCGEVLDERLLQQFDRVNQIVVVEGRPSRYIGNADAIVAEVRGAGFDIDTVHVEARRSTAEQDDLVIRATKSDAPRAHPGTNSRRNKTDT